MICPRCESENNKVQDTGTGIATTIRLRKCLDCDYNFYTEEKVIGKIGAGKELNAKKRRISDEEDDIKRLKEIGRYFD